MLFATSTSITVYAKYISNRVGKTGLTVTCSIRGPGGAIANAQATTEVDSTNHPGLYSYTLSSANDATEGAYVFHFTTSDTTVDQRDWEVLVYCFAWVGYVNGAGGTLDKQANQVSLSGTASAGSSSTIRLAGGSATSDLYVGQTVYIVSGTGAGQARIIKTYNGSNKDATVAQDWVTAPDATSVFVVRVTGRTFVATIADGAISATTFAANALDAVLDRLTSTLNVAGSIGKLLVDNINATISSRLASTSYTTPPTVTAIRTEMDNNSTKLANLDAAVSSRSSHSVSDIWSYLKSSAASLSTTMIGRFIYDALTAIQGKTDLLGSGSVSVTSPLNPTAETLTVIHRDDYLGTFALTFDIDGYPDFVVGTTAKFSTVNSYRSNYQSVDATVNGTNQVIVELENDYTDVIQSGYFDVQVTYPIGSIDATRPVVKTVRLGTIVVTEDVTV